MEKSKAKEILERYIKGECTQEEKALVEEWYNRQHNQHVDPLVEKELMKELETVEKALGLSRGKPVYRRLIAAAAAVLVFAITGWWLYRVVNHKPATDKQPLASAQEVIVPGGNKAILTLANGKKISLTDAGKGNIASETGIRIAKTADGQMAYQVTDVPASAVNNVYNTIETPVGGQYQVLLPDGTKVWLNARSALRFPVHFSETERRVEISGEVYLEVAPDKAKPFRVVSPGQVVEVLGTHFNVNTYDNESAIKTTLLEGAVKVAANGAQTVLKPGQQASLAAGTLSTLDDVNTDDVVAWKNNKIQFTDLDIHSVMRMLERWYNIEVVYAGGPINTTFGGSVSRSKNIDVILKLLETTGDIHFKIEGRRVIVMP
jgi:ferric-dicitrate binding protein FerR (iron transport regulator)